MARRRAWLEPAIWALLWLAYVPLTRSWQPSWLIAALATAILLGMSATLLHAMPMLAGKPPLAFAPRWAMRVLATVAAGCAAAFAIRLLYFWLAPQATPFSLPLNIVVDSLWVAIHAALVGRLRSARR